MDITESKRKGVDGLLIDSSRPNANASVFLPPFERHFFEMGVEDAPTKVLVAPPPPHPPRAPFITMQMFKRGQSM